MKDTFLKTLTKIGNKYAAIKYNEDFSQYTSLNATIFVKCIIEPKRIKDKCYPLVEWGMTEKDCLQYCYERGFDWDGLYEHFDRVSCWCCPLKNLKELEILYKYYPELWEELKKMDKRAYNQFRKDYSVEQLEEKFKQLGRLI